MAERHHEETDANVTGVYAFAIGLIASGGVVLVIVWLLFVFLAREKAPEAPQFPLATQQENRLPPEPRLQVEPRKELATFRAEEDAILGGYGWVDRNNGVVRIPIDEAMKLAVQRGLPSR